MDRPDLIAELGSGGMATVFLAMRRGMGGFAKLVVVKRLRPDALDGDALAMFQDEARLSARMNHPNVVQTHEVGFDGDHFRLEMEYLDGQPLHRIVSRARKAGRKISAGLAVALVREVLAGLHYAHELRDYDGSPLGIVHRDVSPQNVFVTYDGLVKLVDFGIAKAAGQVAVTQFGMVKGKLRYMSPEQALGRQVDRRADVFSTGVVLWQLLTGRSYWGDADQMTVVKRLSKGDLPPPPRQLSDEIPEELDRICARALAFDVSDRYATAEEFLHALDDVPCETSARAFGKLAAELFVDTRRAVREAIENAARPPVEEEETKLVSLALSSSASQPALVLPGRTTASSASVAAPARSRAAAILATLLAVFLGVAGVMLIVSAKSRVPIAARSTGDPSPPSPRETRPKAEPAPAAPPDGGAAPKAVTPGEAPEQPSRAAVRARPVGGSGGKVAPSGPKVDAGGAPAGEPPHPARGRGRSQRPDLDPWDALGREELP